MCGIAGVFGKGWDRSVLAQMTSAQRHRGPDDQGDYVSSSGVAGLSHCRLSIIDLSPTGHQPMHDPSGRFHIIFNGEVYNYVELARELAEYPFQSTSDTEVVLAAYQTWGPTCLARFEGMFAFAIWDETEKRLFAARDRFGVKPLYYAIAPNGSLLLASEVKALFAAGLSRSPNDVTWATYLATGMYDHTTETFWSGVHQVPPGAYITWTLARGVTIGTWYDLADTVSEAGEDDRDPMVVADELKALLLDSVKLRFRSDVPVGVCLSGGLDSSLLVAVVDHIGGCGAEAATFTFACGDPYYDETPWVREVLQGTQHRWHVCSLSSDEVPELAEQVQWHQDEPFGGVPTLGMAKVHQRAQAEGVTVLLDGNGMDEAWAGYDYYRQAKSINQSTGPVQGCRSRSTRPDCLDRAFAELSSPYTPQVRFDDAVRQLQYRDIRYAKIPRAMRFADRVSMMWSRELRDPFLDHRVVELGLRQPLANKVKGSEGKWIPRQVAKCLLPKAVREAPKRAVQTPQREWLRGPLCGWATTMIEEGVSNLGRSWFDANRVRDAWHNYQTSSADNSFPVWQWISVGLLSKTT